MDKFQRSWSLLKSSLSIISGNPKLLVFPIVIFTCTLAILLFFLAPPLLRPTGHPFTSAAHWKAISDSLFAAPLPLSQVAAAYDPPDDQDAPSQNAAKTRTPGKWRGSVFTPAALAYLVFMYFLSMFVATFFNVAFYHEILGALSGQAVSIGGGLKFALTKLKAILMWTLFAGLVGLIIKQIEQRLDFMGQLVAKVLGVAWSVASVFVIPILVRDAEPGANPFAMLRKSGSILKRTWGEALIGYAGLAFANTLIVIGSLLVLAAAVVGSFALHSFLLFACVFASWLLAVFAWGYLTSVASQVYRGALYLYAAEGTVPQPYDQEMLNAAWKFRK